MSGFRLAVCAEMVFLDQPFTERVRRIAEGWASVPPEQALDRFRRAFSTR